MSKRLAFVFTVGLLLAAGCGDDDNDKTSTTASGADEQLAQQAADGCKALDDEAADLAKDPTKGEDSGVVREIQRTKRDASTLISESKDVSGNIGSYAGDAADATSDGARQLGDVAAEDNALEAARAGQKNYDQCVAAIKKLDTERKGEDLADALTGEGFDQLISALKVKETAEQAPTETTPQTQTTPQQGDRSADLPLCSQGPPPCRTEEGQILEPGQEGEGGGEAADLPECSAGSGTPCRNPDGTVQP